MTFLNLFIVISFIAVAFIVSIKPILGLALISIVSPFVLLMDVPKLPLGIDKILGFLVLFGFVINILKDKSPKMKFKRTPLDVPIMVLVIAYFLAFLMSALTRGLNSEMIISFLSLLSLFVIYFLTVNLVWDKASFNILFYSLFLGAVLLASVSLFLYFNKVNMLFGLQIARAPVIPGVPRLQGFSGNPNSFSTIFVLLIPISVFMLIGAKSVIKRVFFFMTIILFTVSIILSFSRSAYLGCIIGISTVSLYFLISNRFEIREILGFILGFMVLIIILRMFLIRTGSLNAFLLRSQSFKTGEAFGTRPELYPATLKLILDNPLGIGYGSYFYTAITKYGVSRKIGSHNTILGIGAQTGWLGLLAIIWFICWQIKQFLYKLRQSKSLNEYLILGGFLGGIIAFWTHSSLHSFLHWGFVWLFFGLGMASCRIFNTSMEKGSLNE